MRKEPGANDKRLDGGLLKNNLFKKVVKHTIDLCPKMNINRRIFFKTLSLQVNAFMFIVSF